MMFAVIAVGIAVGGLALYVGNGVVARSQQASKRMAGLQTREDVLEGGFSERAVAPILEGLGRGVLRFTPTGWVAKKQHKLVLAGWAERLDGNAWAAIRIISIAASFGLWVLFQNFASSSTTKLIMLGLFLLLGVLLPESRLNSAIGKRRKAMERQLPDVIDLLVISVEAGLGFDAALGRVVQNVPGELSKEFQRTLQETRVGVSRTDALRNLVERTDVDDLNTFVLALIQADQFGVSIARVLRVQAEEMRIRRRQRAQEKAFAAPVKLVFPLMFFILPALFIVILGPAVITISGTLFGAF
ncbi:MAG: type II secretion system F family protein [Actinomycetota bacterium]|nr:type II secretion system F family protein [Actinomycetota bacterium]